MVRRFAIALSLLIATGVLLAQPVPREFQRVLPMLQPLERARLATQFATWRGWAHYRREAFAARMRAWDALPPAERQQRRSQWQAWRGLTASDRTRVKEAARSFAAMDPAEQQALRARFEALGPTRQHGWRLGPTLGADYLRLQPLLAQVPTDQHAALLRTLRVMSPTEREDLAVLVWRTPPHEREALRRELASTADANRAAWLLGRLER